MVNIAYDSLFNRLPPPLKELAKVVKNVSKATKLIKRQGFFSGYVTATGTLAGGSIGAFYGGPVGGMVGAEVGEYIARPIGDLLEQAKMREAEIAVKVMEGGGIPFWLCSHH